MAVGPDIVRFMNEARVNLPGATDDNIQLALFSVMDLFFKGSNTWQQDIVVPIGAKDPAGTIYAVVPDSPSIIDKLMWVFEQPKDPLDRPTRPIGAAMQTPGELTLFVQPSSTTNYIVTVALSVQDPTTRNGYVAFPAWILAKYRDAILSGLLGRMMSQPSKPFTNTQLSVFHMRKFNSKVASARVEVTRNNTYRQQAWAFPGFGRGSQRGNSGWGGPV